MLHGLLRDRIRALASGESGNRTRPGPISTFTQDTVHRLRPRVTGADERELLTRFGRRIAESLLQPDGLSEQQRGVALHLLCREEFSPPG